MLFDILCTNFLAIVVFFLVLVLFVRAISRPAHLPPGPRRWPVIGNFPSLRGDMLQALQNLRREYGDVYLLYMGNHPTVFVHRQKYVQEVLVTRGEEFLDRPKLFFTDTLSKGKARGIGRSSGALWADQRRFVLHTLKNFGFGKSSLEGKVMEEVEVLIQCLKDKAGEAFFFHQFIHVPVVNVICSIVFGHSFYHNDSKLLHLIKTIEDNIKMVGFSGALNFVPWLQYLPGDMFYIDRIRKGAKDVEQFVMDEINSHKHTLNRNEPGDFIDVYLVEIEKSQKTDWNSSFDDEQLLEIIKELFIAGFDTTAATLKWALFYLVNYPEVQTKVRSEIHSVVGKDRLPSLTDRKHMPYVEATIMEIQRCGDIAPLGFPRAASRDTMLKGFYIPKGTTVITVLNSLLMDSHVWENPEVFDPNRFLDAEGNVIKPEYFWPFSAGKRVCLGKSLAKMEIFLFLTSMLQTFEFKTSVGMTTLPNKRILGISQTPAPFSLRAVVTM